MNDRIWTELKELIIPRKWMPSKLGLRTDSNGSKTVLLRCSYCADRIRTLIARMVFTKRWVVAGICQVMLRCSFCADRIVVRLRARVLTEAPGRSWSLSRFAVLQLPR